MDYTDDNLHMLDELYKLLGDTDECPIELALTSIHEGEKEMSFGTLIETLREQYASDTDMTDDEIAHTLAHTLLNGVPMTFRPMNVNMAALAGYIAAKAMRSGIKFD